ncbi:hypothetical protein J3D56_001428 [Erwinia persicina]|uniref:hypothetical protein n=1 Tax=Erwinia persicina TaxID=55211 RepID=UPI00209D4D9B|nr:hypothetical protein [Erwinia persicina]MCP1437992.1 hypothetical protein [Erwinia persicina]
MGTSLSAILNDSEVSVKPVAIQFSSPEHRHKLVWLCWYDLMIGATLEDWLDNLKRKAPEDLGLWLIGRQEENISLMQIMDEYLLFTGH